MQAAALDPRAGRRDGGDMSKDEPPAPPARPKPALTPAAEAAKRAREERLAAALRENLRKRKAQARVRKEGALDNGDKD